jgi:hypothetical protein
MHASTSGVHEFALKRAIAQGANGSIGSARNCRPFDIDQNKTIGPRVTCCQENVRPMFFN